MNDQTAEPIGPKFCEGPLKAPSEGLWFLFYNLKIYKEKMFTIQIEM